MIDFETFYICSCDAASQAAQRPNTGTRRLPAGRQVSATRLRSLFFLSPCPLRARDRFSSRNLDANQMKDRSFATGEGGTALRSIERRFEELYSLRSDGDRDARPRRECAD